ncbi:MAG: arginine--tRNA ligase [Oscillospiraceae bacterium]|jgi:arginyl-tRNA synthetase|nr:arginine--tRNA ligase [Oscillospiraceae bacterium]
MSSLLIKVTEDLKNNLIKSIGAAIKGGKLLNAQIPDINIEIPADRAHGELSTNIAMVSAKLFRVSPLNIAEIILDNLAVDKSFVSKVEIAGAGFINFFLSQKFFSECLAEIKSLGEEYGKCNYGQNKKLILEFVSANPTGPMHVGNARLGVLGDCLSSVLKLAGYDVFKEFYVNDAGNQIEKFASSLDVRYRQIIEGEKNVFMPEDCYQGEDIKDLSYEFYEVYGKKYALCNTKERKDKLTAFALPKNIDSMKKDMKKYNIFFDNWFHESLLYESNNVSKVIDMLSHKGLTYEFDGALWYKATKFGFEKDEVLIRKNGIHTYFASDIAYHYNKFKVRNFDICIDIWGADHHGHVARLKSAMDSLGVDSGNLHILLVQLVKLVKNGEVVRMSKRTGKAIKLADLLDEVSVDSARFIFNMKEANTKMDFDLDLAVQKDSQNPVYYVQYAHARICNILKSVPDGVKKNLESESIELDVLTSFEEKQLIYDMALYTTQIINSAKNFDPTGITKYVIDLATDFHKFYNDHKVICDDDQIMSARIYLCMCVKIVISNILRLFKISIPEHM